ncbi:pH-response regulator protein palA/rim20 [Malassezia sp. CBS 17886]|nr:pH-response regulator protein palA/rim20 [Malassezia sp. CBS 17886]
MSNLLGLPTPRSQRVDLGGGVHAYLRDAYADINADALDRDCAIWTETRNECLALSLQAGSVGTILRYAHQLAFMMVVMPGTLPFALPWRSGFAGASAPLGDNRTLGAEHACIMLMAASYQSQLGRAEPRRDSDSLRRAANYFQQAAGTLLRLAESMASRAVPASVPELHPGVLRGLADLMLAQAQECFWQKARQDGLKNTNIARLAQGAADLYAGSLAAVEKAGTSALPSGWLAHIRCKRWHFAAVAQFRLSCSDLAHKRHGDELGRLALATEYADAAAKAPPHALPEHVVAGDLASLRAVIDENLRRAEKDNQLIYLAQPTAPASLSPIEGAVMVREAPVPELRLPYQDGEALWFARLITYGIDVALRLYLDAKAQFVQDLEARQMQLDDAAAGALRTLRLPELLDRIEQPAQVPKACVAQAQTAATHTIPAAASAVAQNSAAAAACREILHATADPLFRARVGLGAAAVQSQHELQMQWREYDSALQQAVASDAKLSGTLTEATRLLGGAAGGDARAAYAPSTSALERARRDVVPQLRALRALLERVDDLKKERRAAVVVEMSAHCDTDDVRARLVAAAQKRHLGMASTSASPSRVEAAALQDIVEEEMDKFQVYAARLDGTVPPQRRLLKDVDDACARLLRHAPLAAAFAGRHRVSEDIGKSTALLTQVTADAADGRAFYCDLHPLLCAFSDACAFPGGEIRFAEDLG